MKKLIHSRIIIVNLAMDCFTMLTMTKYRDLASVTKQSFSLCLLTLCLLMTGCHEKRSLDVAPQPYNKYYNNVRFKMNDVVIYYYPNQTSMTPIQRDQLLHFLKSKPTAQIRLAACAQNHPTTNRQSTRIAYLTQFLKRRGYYHVVRQNPLAAAEDEPDCIVLSLTHVDFYGTDCDKMRYVSPYTDPYGCATKRNLAKMLANPRDLTQRKQLHYYHAEVVGDAVERYYQGGSNASSGSSSSAGQ